MKPTGKVLKPAVLGLLCAFLLASTNLQTRDIISQNQRTFEEQQLREMVSGAAVKKNDDGYDVLSIEGSVAGKITYSNTNQGYNGRIQFLLAKNNQGQVTAIRVTHHSETPGLGDKIDHTVSDWVDQFSGRSLANSTWRLRPYGDIDAITGATITSKAMVEAIRLELSQ